jgi:hypothetical protein
MPSSSRKRKKSHTCDDCFFRCNHLCALNLGGPCATFRPNTQDGLVPPRQPALLIRDPAGAHSGVRLADTG